MEHTEESLDALRLKGEVIEIAEGLGLATEGTRQEITDRILASQEETSSESGEGVASPEDSSASVSQPAEAGDSGDSAADEEPERARTEDGHFAADDPNTQPDEALAGAPPQPISDKAKLGTVQLLESYFGKKGVSKDMRDTAFAALEEGYQPCVVKGGQNARYAFKVFEEKFSLADVSKDVRTKEGVVLNIARRLSTSRLYPSA